MKNSKSRWKPGWVETNTRSSDVEMKNESIFQRKRKKFFPFVYQDLFHSHTFIHFFLSCWRNEIPKDIFSFFFSMGWNQSLLLESSSSSHPIDPNFRNEKLKSKDPKKMSETLATKVFFLSLRLIFYL